MEKRELTCICCPIGCQIEVTLEGKEVKEIKGNTCKRGAEYAKTETVAPVRVVTSTVRVEGAKECMVPVKTGNPVPKEKIFECMKEINDISVKAPVKTGDVIICNVAGTSVDVVATKSVGA